MKFKSYFLYVIISGLALIEIYQYHTIQKLKSTIEIIQTNLTISNFSTAILKEISLLNNNKLIRNNTKMQPYKIDKIQVIRNVKITYYSNDPISINVKKYRDGLTSIGLPVTEGVIAVDPKIIPYGTIVYVPCLHKFYIAADTGSKIKGFHIDVYVNSREEAIKRGVHYCDIVICGRINIRKLVSMVRCRKEKFAMK